MLTKFIYMSKTYSHQGIDWLSTKKKKFKLNKGI